jgi:hypothetical protein
LFQHSYIERLLAASHAECRHSQVCLGPGRLCLLGWPKWRKRRKGTNLNQPPFQSRLRIEDKRGVPRLYIKKLVFLAE